MNASPAISGLVAVMLLASAAVGQNTAAALEGEITIVLEDALAANYRGEQAQPQPLSIHLTREDGAWTEAWGKALTFNTSLHDVKVVDSTLSDDTVELELEVRVDSDLWIRGGPAHYTVQLSTEPVEDGRILSPHPLLRTRSARLRLQGTYEGHFEGPEATFEAGGGAIGLLWQARTTHSERELRQTLQRPRLLLRPEDVSTIRERLETPLGAAMLERLETSVEREGQPDTTIGHAVLYLLTGEEAHAEAAAEQARVEMTAAVRPEHGELREHQSDYYADRIHRVGFALDLCREAWSQQLREQVIDFIDPISHSGLHNPHQWGSGAVITPGQSISDKMYGACGLGAMLLWGQPGDPPQAPQAEGGTSALQQRFGAADGLSHEQRLERYRHDLDRWREAGGADRKYLEDARHARRMVLTGALRAVGEGGTGGHPYTYDFALAWRNVFGRDISPRPDLSLAGIKPVLSTLWESGTEGEGHLERRTPFGGDLPDGGMLARMYAVGDPDYQPAMLWYWLNLAGIDAADLDTEAGARRFAQTIPLDDPLAMAYVLLHLPEAAETIDPARQIPRIWLAETPGTLWARSDFEGTDTILTRYTARQMGGAGPSRGVVPNVGHFDIYGLGHHWAGVGGSAGLPDNAAARQRFNAVQLTDMDVNGWARGQLLSFTEMPEEPAAALTQDLSDAYHRLERAEVTRTVTERRGNLTVDRPITETRTSMHDEGITAQRSFAVDLSGAAGAPGLFAVIDRITGEQSKQWTLHVPDLADSDVTIDGNTFTIDKGDARLRGTFIAPADVHIEKKLDYTGEVYYHRGKIQGWKPYRRDVLTATAADAGEGDFFVVMTLQRGEAPPVEIDGDGLAATVTVGERTIRFDGDRILLNGLDDAAQ